MVDIAYLIFWLKRKLWRFKNLTTQFTHTVDKEKINRKSL